MAFFGMKKGQDLEDRAALPTKNFQENPRRDSESRAGKRSEKWVKVLRCLKFPSGRTYRGDHACHFLVTAVITINFKIKIL